VSELAVRQERGVALTEPTMNGSATFDRLARWAEAAQAAHGMATSLVQTSFVPEAFRNKPHEATAAILAGAEIGLDPMAALRSFDIIQGTAAPRANTLRAVVQSRGHEIVVAESTATRAVVRGRRRGEANWQESRWTIERAKGLNLTGKKNWREQPGAMLVARATAECARLIASDAILGIPYASEELDDGIEAPPVDEVKPTRRTAQRAARPVEPVETVVPARVDEPEPEFDTDPEEAEPITTAQQRKLHALLRDKGLGNRDAGLRAISMILEHPVGSTKELTKADAMTVIDRLEDLPEAADAEPALDEPGSEP
jgi:hypothetical protein